MADNRAALRHLGAAYYQSLHGDATHADLTSCAPRARRQDTPAMCPAAARLMNTSHLRMLPVADGKERLLGIVTRRELLSVFLRPDGDIASDIREMLTVVLSADADKADASVRDGVVTLTGELEPTAGPHGDLIPVAIRLMRSIDGVVDVIDHLGKAPLAERQPGRDRGSEIQ